MNRTAQANLLENVQGERILVFAPLGRDASLLGQTLAQAGLVCTTCTHTVELQTHLLTDYGVALLTEEALTPETIAVLKQSIESQSSWSDLPLALLVNKAWQGLKSLSFASNLTVLERPTRIPILCTTLHTVLKARRRQYQVRELLEQQENMNAQLEARVSERTSELRTANAQLKEEIAEHEKAKRDLLESEGRFEKAFRVGPVAASITTLEEGRFIDVNESFETLTGYTCEEVVGETERHLSMWASREDQAKMTAAIRGVGNYHDLELQVRTKAGDTRDILASAEVIEVNGTTCLLHMFYDITERKQTEEEMLQAINEVMQDAAWFSRSLMEKLAQVRAKRTGKSVNTNEVAELTKREKQVLEQMARGCSNVAIASDLGLAERTVRNYITKLYEKLGVHSRVEAVVWARERGLVSF